MSDETKRDDRDETSRTGEDHATGAKSSADETERPQVFNVARPGGRRAFLGTLSRGAAVGATAVVGDSCKSTPTTPTAAATTSTTTTSTTTSTTSVSTTTAAPTATLAGVVTDQRGGAVPNARVFVVDGPNANKSSTTDGNGYYSIPALVFGSFTLRTTLNGFFLGDRPVTIGRDTRLDFAVTTTSTTSTTTSAPTTTSVRPGCTCDTVHYWFPN